MRVLVVEDNDDVGRFSTELLEDLGYTVRRVENAAAALAMLAEDAFSADLVFSDVIMPGMNGVELAGATRERYPGLPGVLAARSRPGTAETDHRGLRPRQRPRDRSSSSSPSRASSSSGGRAILMRAPWREWAS